MREWSEGDLDALKMLAQIFANAFERQRIEVAIRRHEQELQTLVEYSPDIISRFDCDMRCVYISSALTKFFGTVPQDVIGKRANELGMPVEEGLLLETTARQVLATGQPATVVVALPYSKAGSSMGPDAVQYFQMRMAAVLDLRGDVESVLCISRDITELERVKQQIEGLNRTLERRVVERTKQLENANLYLELEVAQHERHKVELLASRTRLRNVAQQVVTAQEEERQRISRVLHDEVTQDLMALTMTLAWMQNELPEKETELRRRLDASIVTVEMAMEQIDLVARLAEPFIGHHRIDGSQCFFDRLRDHHALSGGQAIGFHHDRGTLPANEVLGGHGILETAISGGRHPETGDGVFHEAFRPFQTRRLGAGAKG